MDDYAIMQLEKLIQNSDNGPETAEELLMGIQSFLNMAMTGDYPEKNAGSGGDGNNTDEIMRGINETLGELARRW
jgi:hypothetical protein